MDHTKMRCLDCVAIVGVREKVCGACVAKRRERVVANAGPQDSRESCEHSADSWMPSTRQAGGWWGRPLVEPPQSLEEVFKRAAERVKRPSYFRQGFKCACGMEFVSIYGEAEEHVKTCAVHIAGIPKQSAPLTQHWRDVCDAIDAAYTETSNRIWANLADNTPGMQRPPLTPHGRMELIRDLLDPGEGMQPLITKEQAVELMGVSEVEERTRFRKGQTVEVKATRRPAKIYCAIGDDWVVETGPNSWVRMTSDEIEPV